MSRLIVIGVLAGDSFPEPSVAVAVTMFGPSVRVIGINHVPSGATVTGPNGTPSTSTLISAPGSPVPPMVGFGLGVVAPSIGSVITGASGAVVSTTVIV